MQVNFYNFKKRLNSTLTPFDKNAVINYQVDYNVNLKAPTSITTPILTLSGHFSAGETDYRNNLNKILYCFIPVFERFYFVDDITIKSNNLIEFTLSCDLLATFKTDILNSEKIVLRTSDINAMDNIGYYLPDEALKHAQKPYSKSIDLQNRLHFLNKKGYYFVQVANGQKKGFAGTTLYILDESDLEELCSYMYDKVRISDLKDSKLVATYYNPLQYIISCIWMPITDIGLNTEGTDIRCGWTNTGIRGRYLKQSGKTFSIQLDLHNYIKENQYIWTKFSGDWLKITLNIGGFGTVPIPIEQEFPFLWIKIRVDFFTGNAFLKVLGQDYNNKLFFITSANGKLGTSIRLSQLQTQPTWEKGTGGLIGSAVKAAGAVLFGNSSANFLNGNSQNLGIDPAKNLSNSITQSVFEPKIMSNGTNGERGLIYYDLAYSYLTIEQFEPINSGYEYDIGLPYGKKCLVGSLKGFCKLANGLIEINGTTQERNAICTILENGFYIEE